MHQTRSEITKKIPIQRKGTKYVARSLVDLKNSVPVVMAVRDMLKLARTAKEVREMIKQKSLKINGKEVKDYRDSIRLFNIFEAGKTYILTLTKTHRFALKETSSKEKICKVTNKKILKGNKVQLNLHDGSNILSTKKINVHDTVHLDFSGKITKHISFEKGKDCFIDGGKYLGFNGKIEDIKGNKVTIQLEDKSPVLEKRRVIVL